MSVRDEFSEAVNMSPKELEEWLETEESKAVGWSDDVEHSRWRYSLMNWGHDPLRK